jgi:hypothetical protein
MRMIFKLYLRRKIVDFKVGQMCYMVNGYSGFCKVMGISLPIKCKIESYDANKDEYEVGVIEKQPEVSYHELKDGNYMRLEQRHTLIGVKSQNLMGAVLV